MMMGTYSSDDLGRGQEVHCTSAFHTISWCSESSLVFKLPSFRALKFRLNDVKIAIYQLCPPLHIR